MKKMAVLAIVLGACMLTGPSEAQRESSKKEDKKDAKVYMTMDGTVSTSTPTGFYVEGYRDGNGINPTSGVKGGKDSDLCVDTSPQYWLELGEGDIPSPAVGRLELPPLVRGCMKDGKFVPVNREVVCHIGLAQ